MNDCNKIIKETSNFTFLKLPNLVQAFPATPGGDGIARLWIAIVCQVYVLISVRDTNSNDKTRIRTRGHPSHDEIDVIDEEQLAYRYAEGTTSSCQIFQTKGCSVATRFFPSLGAPS